MKLSWKQKAVVYLPGITANIAGLLNCVFAALLIKEHGITVFTTSVAVFFAFFGLFLTLIGYGMTLQWKEDLEEYW